MSDGTGIIQDTSPFSPFYLMIQSSSSACRKKTDWVLPYEYSLNLNLTPIIAERFPNLRKTAQKLGIHFNPEILLTSIWPAVVQPAIEIHSPLVADMTTLANAFPNVNYLQLISGTPWTGSLDSFEHLVHLEILKIPNPHDSSIPTSCSDSLLLSHSAKSIAYLALGGDAKTVEGFSWFHLKHFDNLQDLQLHGVYLNSPRNYSNFAQP
jgi:hypothetical protein